MSPEAITRRGLLVGPLLLAACGFAPAYGPGGAGDRLQGRITVEAPGTPDGFRLRAGLEDRLGATSSAAAVLSVEPTVEVSEAVVMPDGAITRYHLQGRAPWRLVTASGAVLAEGEATGFTGYSATGSTVAVRAAEGDARERLMGLLAEGVLEELLLVSPESLP